MFRYNKYSTVSHHSSIGTVVFSPCLCSHYCSWHFAIKNTQPSNMQSEHSIMIANFCQLLYFADSLSRKKYSFFKQQYELMMPEQLQSHPSVCGFYTIYAAFHLFKFCQKEITGVHDVNVLSFISIYTYFFNFSKVNVQVIECVCY